MGFHFPDIVGRYRFVVSPEVLEFVERAFVEKAPVEERDQIRAEALAEAAAAEFEVTANLPRSFGGSDRRPNPRLPPIVQIASGWAGVSS